MTENSTRIGMFPHTGSLPALLRGQPPSGPMQITLPEALLPAELYLFDRQHHACHGSLCKVNGKAMPRRKFDE